MLSLRRFLVVQSLLLWQGGFLFYAAVVVPTGTRVVGVVTQGAITARVTATLNVLGVVALAVLALDLWLTRDPSRRRSVCRWAGWSFALLCQCLLFYLHLKLESLMDEGRMWVANLAPFYPTHRMYLLASTAQWLACVLLIWWTLRAWRAEDRVSLSVAGLCEAGVTRAPEAPASQRSATEANQRDVTG